MKTLKKALLIALCLAPGVWAVVPDSIDTAGKILLLNSGARSEGLAGCGAFLGESYSGLYNPAALVLIDDVAGTIYSNPTSNFLKGFDYWALTAAAHSEFGYVGIYYLYRKGVENSDTPPEEATGLSLAGHAWKNLSLGASLKILSIRSGGSTAPSVPLNEPISKTFKTVVDLGLVWTGILPGMTWKPYSWEESPWRRKFGRPVVRGFSLGVAFLNLGGQVKYSETNVAPLPQTFKADLQWTPYQGKWWDVRLFGEVEKLLVARNEALGYKGASEALFSAWGGGHLEGGWIGRGGVEVNAFCWLSGRFGWIQDEGARRFFHCAGAGLGPEWLRFNAAAVHEPGSNLQWTDELRYDLTANFRYEMLKKIIP